MKRFFTFLSAALLSCAVSVAQWGGGWDFAGGGGNSSGSIDSYTNKKNIDYVGDGHVGHKLDIYYPNDGKATHNVVIHIYGSAWGANDSKGSADHGTVGKAVLEAGYIFVTPNHRTYNDALWPAQINDIKAVVRYLRGNAKELGIDDSFIAVSGFSSGGHLASMMGVTNNEKVVKVGSVSVDIEGNLGKYTSFCSSVNAVCDWSGPVDCRDKSCGNPINMSPENDMVGGCTPQSCPDKHASLGTNTYIDKNDVPHFICHGSSDNIVPQCEGEKYANNLKKAGVYVEWVPGSHGHQVDGGSTGKMVTFLNKIREEGKSYCDGGTGNSGNENGNGGNESGNGGNNQGENGNGGTSSADPKEDFQIYIAIGQSNMWGNATVQSGDKATHDRIKMMSTANSRGNVGTWLPAVPPMCAPGAGYSLADKFIREMADNAPECVTIGIIPVAIAGASFKAFDPNQCASYFSTAESWLQNMAKEYDNNPYKRIVECAKKAQETGTIKGIILHQGESDSGQQSWLTMVSTFYDNLCKDLGLDKTKTPLIVGQMLEGGACAGHNSIIAQLPSKITNCAVVSTSSIPGESDRLHFTHDGYTELGKRYATKMLEMASLNSTCTGSGNGGNGGNSGSNKNTPYKGTATNVPGKVECENYDEGGANVAYSDSDTKNQGNANFRSSEEVDVVKAGNGMAVGYTKSSEWLLYTINVTKAGDYYVGANMSNGSGNPKITLSIDGKKIASLTGSGVSNDWDTYALAASSDKVSLTAGEHVLKMQIDADNTNVDYVIFSAEKLASGTGGGGGGSTGGSTGACAGHPDPCSQNTSMSSGSKAQNGGTHNISGGFNYEMWTNSGNNASMEYTSKEGMFQFKANWNNPDDLLCRIGLYWGNGPSFDKLDGDLHCDFNYESSGTGGGYNYIGIYGWTKTPHETEYYIVENTFFGSTAKQQGLYYGASSKGKYTMDGEEYELWVGTRNNAPSISGTSTFTQVFAVRKSIRKCGHISISAHMRQWAKMGVDMQGSLYDCKFLCEVGSGSGSFDMKYGNIWIGDCAEPDPTDVEETSAAASGITLAPNPAETYFSVICDEEITKVDMINTMGQIVASQTETDRVELNIPSGIYLVRAYTATGAVYTKTLMVK